MNRARYLAVPFTSRSGRTGWGVFQLPIGNTSPVARTYAGPLAGWRAKRRAAAMNRGPA